MAQMIENEVFKRRTILFDRLENFGFERKNGVFVLTKNIYEGMTAVVTVSADGAVTGEVFDEDFTEPYVNYRVEGATGAFVVGVRNAYLAFLNEIARAVTEEKLYMGCQTNRIHSFICEKYAVKPEFMWKKFPHFGVYRNVESKKWFAIIMDIGRGKVFPKEEGEIEVMNLKLDERAEEYVKSGAAHPSYHMNHKSWVTVVFDDGVPDQTIQEMIEISFQNSFKKK